ncbi:RsbRD N-terminal domain-containing protein [Acidobacteriota bacterium]
MPLKGDPKGVLKRLLEQHQKAILERWNSRILDSYPADTANFLKRERDQFANPVGHAITSGTEALYSGLLEEAEAGTFETILSDFIKIRAVQEFSPSQAIVFVLMLKNAARDVLSDDINKEEIYQEWLNFESKIDNLALLAFDIYMECREKIFTIRIKELQKQATDWVALRKQRKENKG